MRPAPPDRRRVVSSAAEERDERGREGQEATDPEEQGGRTMEGAARITGGEPRLQHGERERPGQSGHRGAVARVAERIEDASVERLSGRRDGERRLELRRLGGQARIPRAIEQGERGCPIGDGDLGHALIWRERAERCERWIVRQGRERATQGGREEQRRHNGAILAQARRDRAVGVENDVEDHVIVSGVKVVAVLAPARRAQMDLDIAAPQLRAKREQRAAKIGAEPEGPTTAIDDREGLPGGRPQGIRA